MNKKQIIKLICFALCVVLILLALENVFHYDRSHMKNRLYTYTQLENDTVDAVYLGTSAVHCFWIPGQAYTDYGQTVFPVTINGMQVWHVLPMLRYARRYQDPGLFIIDIRPFTVNGEPAQMAARSRYCEELLPRGSFLRLSATNRALKYMSRIDEEIDRFDISYYFSMLNYHTMWEDGIDFESSDKTFSKAYGYLLSDEISKEHRRKQSVFTDETEPLEDFAQECLEELIDYAEKEDIQLLFVNSPRYQGEEVAKKCNQLFSYLEGRNVPYFDFCREENTMKYVFSRKTDFYDGSHVNYYGAVKYTRYLSEYLDEQYELTDRRKDKNCNDWKKGYKWLKKRLKKYGVKVKDSNK